MASNTETAKPLTPSEQYQLLRAVGIEDGAVFDVDIIGEGWTVQNNHGVIEVVRGPLEPRTHLHGVLAFWMLSAYANSHGIAGFSVGFSTFTLKQVAAWLKALPSDTRPDDLRRACGKFWAIFKREAPMRGDA